MIYYYVLICKKKFCFILGWETNINFKKYFKVVGLIDFLKSVILRIIVNILYYCYLIIIRW